MRYMCVLASTQKMCQAAMHVMVFRQCPLSLPQPLPSEFCPPPPPPGECCGGFGVLAINKIAPMSNDMNVDVTFEGDNTVLLQQVRRVLLGLPVVMILQACHSSCQ